MSYQLLFRNATEMMEALQNRDLYSPTLELYIFAYNDIGSICCYNISPSEAATLERKSREQQGEYWGAFLGPGGSIYDAPEHELFNPENGISNLEFCKNLFSEDWIYTTDVLDIDAFIEKLEKDEEMEM